MLHKKTSFRNLPLLNFAQQILNLVGLVLFAISIMIPIHVFALPQELVKNYGGSPSIDNRVASGLLVLYTFDEGKGKTIYDISGVGDPLNLTVADETAINWLANGGVVINSPTVISSSNAATKIIDACQDTNEITIEAWITPVNNSQDGPARIVTLSNNPYNRNFTLAQGRWDTQPSEVYDARLRTTTTSDNGRPSITSQVGSLTVELTHVVYTRDSSGTAKIYINVLEEGSGMASGDFSNWNGNYAMALGNELTGDRPWLGEFHLVAIYNRSLSLEEIEQNFVAGQDIGECHSNENCGFCEKCEDGICVSQTDSEDLKDECTEGECKTGYCDGASACGLIFEGTPCNDDGNVCTDDECDGAGECVHLNNNSFCDDGIFCNGDDSCNEGTCSVHSGNPCSDDGIFCNGIEYCEEDTDSCISPGNPCPWLCNEEEDLCLTPSPPPRYCKMVISPSIDTVTSGESVEFTAVTLCNDIEVEGNYQWEVTSTIGSSIGEITGLYTAGGNEGTDTIKVNDTFNYNISATIPVDVMQHEDPPPPVICDISIEPSTATIDSEGTITFTATIPEGEGCLEPDYTWQIDTDIRSKITPGTSTCFYQAGSNKTGILFTDTITVIDNANGTSANATLTVHYGRILTVFPKTLFASRWLYLPRIIFILGEDTDFNSTSYPTFTTDDPITIISKIGIGNLMSVLVLLPPNSEGNSINLLVTTTNKAGQKAVFPLGNALNINLLPLMLDKGE